ncbi:MAG: hypothetical protein RLZZ31_755 [Actinomycetota bacterium]|jgi:NAD(P)-dependent dehydrogenase (short-subunit alcohol dehydrogenase family)
MSVAVITGAGQGLGRADALRLARDGFTIACVDVDEQKARETAELVRASGGNADFYQCDVTQREQVLALGNEISGVTALVNNAGIWKFHSILEMSQQDAHSVYDVNIAGIIWCTQAFVSQMKKAGGGSIVNMSSGAAWTNSPGLGLYPATKSAVESLTRTMALELGPDQIRANAIGPGLIVSDGTAANYQGNRANERAKGVPMQRVGSPEEIADVVSFLCGPDSRYVSGQVLYVDGGITAGSLAR